MQRLSSRLLVAALTFAIGVAAASLWFFHRAQPVVQQATVSAPADKQGEGRSAAVANTDGLEIPGLPQSHISTPRKLYKPLAAHKVHFTELRTDGNVLASFFLYGRQENGDFASGPPEQLGVYTITRWDVAGQPFCYQIMAKVPGVSLVTAYDYYDDDGDGKFDRCVSGKWPRPPVLPVWVSKRK